MNIIPLLKIKQPALLCQIQDEGRLGYLHQGFSTSGAMDERAFRINNEILGNASNCAQLEIAPGGLSLEVLADCFIALTGAYALPMLDNKPLVNWHSYHVKKGQILRMNYPKSGQYCYLGIAGGFQCTPFLGSRATCARLNIYPQPIKRGTELLGYPQPTGKKAQGYARKDIPTLTSDTLTVLPAYQYRDFSLAMRERFSQQLWQVQSSNRMGTLLMGSKPIEYCAGELLSEGIVAGAIQMTHAGMPIVLQKDAQSIGGYPKIGVLTAESRAQLAQAKNGSNVRFKFRDQ